MPNQRAFDEVMERFARTGIKTGSLDSILRGTSPLHAGVNIRVTVPAKTRKAPGGSEYHVKIRASTENVARDAGVIPMTAWKQGGLARFNENPVILAYHDHKQPIGISVHTEISKKENALVEYWLFHEESETSRMMKKLYEKGFMRAASVGFLVHDFELVDEAKEKEMQKQLGTNDPIFWVATRAELLETSAVPVPADPFALAIDHAIENGRASGINVSVLESLRSQPKEIEVAEDKNEKELSERITATNTSLEAVRTELGTAKTDLTAAKTELAAAKTEITELRGLVDLMQERLVKLETPAEEERSEDVEEVVEIELRDDETEDEAIARYLDEAVAKVTGAPVAK